MPLKTELEAAARPNTGGSLVSAVLNNMCPAKAGRANTTKRNTQ